jgi:hypothetical protein
MLYKLQLVAVAEQVLFEISTQSCNLMPTEDMEDLAILEVMTITVASEDRRGQRVVQEQVVVVVVPL